MQRGLTKVCHASRVRVERFLTESRPDVDLDFGADHRRRIKAPGALKGQLVLTMVPAGGIAVRYSPVSACSCSRVSSAEALVEGRPGVGSRTAFQIPGASPKITSEGGTRST
jgi:hypothetical protein